MTNYLYVCPDGHENERDYGFSDTRPSKITCHCKKPAKHRITGQFGIRYTAQPK